MYYRLLDKVIQSNDMLALSKSLKEINAFVKRNDLNNDLYLKFYNDIKKAALKNTQRINVLSEDAWAASYLFHQWTVMDSPHWNEKALRVICNHIQQTFTIPQGCIITPDRAHEILDLVERKYGFLSKVGITPIDILIVNNTIIHYNALYSCDFDLYGDLNDWITLSSIRSPRVAPEFAFLHELGHLLHTRVSKRRHVVPTSFEFLEDTILVKSTTDIMRTELFCEGFAIGVLNNTQHEKCILYDDISQLEKNIISLYFEIFMNTLEHNPDGTLSWKELVALYGNNYNKAD